MRKIPTMFVRDMATKLVTSKVAAGCEWAASGEGWATIMLDGTCCMILDGKLFKRYSLKKGRRAPDNFVAAQEPDPTTGEVTGWVPVGDGPEDQYHREALERLDHKVDGTYELIGPKVQGNAECRDFHVLINHMDESLILGPGLRHFDGIRELLKVMPIEGFVFHHADGRMCKIKARDFGIKRGAA